DAVRNLIRQSKIEQIYSVMQTSTSRGMMTMEQSLAELVQRRVISTDIAYSRSSRPDQLAGILERAGIQEVKDFSMQPAVPAAGLSDVGRPLAGENEPMDMKKELKLSDLIPKRKSGGSSKPKANAAKKKRAK